MDKKNTRVLQGEASESDEEEIVTTNFTKNKVQYNRENEEKVVISGEASESESENEGSDTKRIEGILPPIEITQTSDEYEKKSEYNPKYDSLLQAKLRERNAALRTHLKNTIRDLYTSSTKDVQAITQQLTKSQIAIQDASHCMRLVTNDLFQLEDKLDIVTTCSILPDIKLPELTE